MAVSIRTSLVLAAAALALLALRAFADPPATIDADDSSPNNLCASGHQQSPVDLAAAIPAMAAPLTPKWTTVRRAMIENTGAGLAIHLDDAGGVMLEGARHTLTRIDIRHPSEHTINGRAFPMEIQLVHSSTDGKQLVVSVPVIEGATDPILDRILATAPGRTGKAAISFAIDPSMLADISGGMWRYEGSLTTHPCTEDVTWNVLTEAVTASPAQIAVLSALNPPNARAVQPLNRRYVLKSP